MASFKAVLIDICMSKKFQTKCKTCFWGPRMVLYMVYIWYMVASSLWCTFHRHCFPDKFPYSANNIFPENTQGICSSLKISNCQKTKLSRWNQYYVERPSIDMHSIHLRRSLRFLLAAFRHILSQIRPFLEESGSISSLCRFNVSYNTLDLDRSIFLELIKFAGRSVAYFMTLIKLGGATLHSSAACFT